MRHAFSFGKYLSHMRCARSAALCVAASVLALSACNSPLHPAALPQSEGHLTADRVAASAPRNDNEIPPPARAGELTPPPQPVAPVPTYSVVVTEVPVKELLQALARDTGQNIDIHPALRGLVSLNAIDQPLPAILDRVAQQVNMRYTMAGNAIIVTPDTPYTKTYQLNYINMSRDTTSTIGVSGQITNTSAIGSNGGVDSGVNNSATAITTKSTNDFWRTTEDNLRAILNSTKQQNLSAEARADRLAAIRQAQDEQARQFEAAGRAGKNAGELAAAFTTSQTQTALLPDDVVINPFTGTIVVNATEKQHRLVQEYLDAVSRVIARQVLIEATIIEVDLSKTYQAGINWSKLQASGFSFTQTMIGSAFGAAPLTATGNLLQIGYLNNANDMSATLQLIQEFGEVHVLSSPKLMALNNQTALLKVVDNLVYFDVQSQQGNTTATGTTSPVTYTTTAKTVAVGMVMGVTPQIDDRGRVTLTVHPTISRQTGSAADPNPSLCDVNRQNCLSNNVPIIQTREMESVLQVGSGQTVILGGLMEDDVNNTQQEVPGARRLGALGELFRFHNDNSKKTELVIFLRPTVIANPSLDSADLKFFQRFLPQAPAHSSNE